MARVSNLSRGNYVLGGLGATGQPSAGETMNRALAADLGMREAGLGMEATRQQMDIQRRQEARAQAQFDAQQAAAARARAAQAQLDADNRALIESLRGVGGAGLTLTGGAPSVPNTLPTPENLPGAIAGATGGRAGLFLDRYGPLTGFLSGADDTPAASPDSAGAAQFGPRVDLVPKAVTTDKTGPRVDLVPETVTTGETGPGEMPQVLDEPFTISLYEGGNTYVVDTYGNITTTAGIPVSEDPRYDGLSRRIWTAAGLDPDEMLALVSGTPATPVEPGVLGPIAPLAGERAALSGFQAGLRPSAATTSPFVTPDILDAIGITPEDFARLSLEEQNDILAFQDPTRPGEEPDTSGLGAITSRALQAQRELEDVNRRLETAMASLGRPGADNNEISRFITELSAQRDALEQIVATGEGVVTSLTTTRGRDVLALEGPEAVGAGMSPVPEARAAEEPTAPVVTDDGRLFINPNRPTGDDPSAEDAIRALEESHAARLAATGGTDAVESVAAATIAAPEGFTLQNPLLAYQLSEQLATERQILEAQLEYATARNDPQLYMTVLQQLNSQERMVSEYMANGQVALAEAQRGDFGAIQAIWQAANPGSEIQFYPFEDGTISVYADGEVIGGLERIGATDFIERLARQFNTEYQQALAAQAGEAAERDRFAFEQYIQQEAQLMRELTLEQAKAALANEAAANNIEITEVGNTDPPMLRYNVPGQPPRLIVLSPTQITGPDGRPATTYQPLPMSIPQTE